MTHGGVGTGVLPRGVGVCGDLPGGSPNASRRNGSVSCTLQVFVLAFLFVLACTDPPAQPDPPRPAAVSVTPSAAELTALGATVRLSAAVQDQNARPLASAAVTWTSAAPAVASVDGAGVVTAVANGTAAITATAGTVSATATVAVAQVVASVAVSPVAATVVESDTLRLAGVAADANGHHVPGAAIAWSSADTLVAIVDASGLVTGVAAGAVVVEAVASEVIGEAPIEVAAPLPTLVAVTPDSVVFGALGQTAALSAEVFDQVGRVMADAAVSWASGDTQVVLVDSAGWATAVAEGTSTITAVAGAVSGAAAVMVVQVAGSVTVAPAADTVELGDTLRLSAEAFDENGHRVASARFVWQSSDSTVARVDVSGLVTGAGEGAAIITALAGDANAISAITVENPDRAALVMLYRATGGPNWRVSLGWLTNRPIEQWYGVAADQNRRVIGLDLSNNDLTGSIPPELSNLAALRELHLGGNDLTGSIPPELGNFTALESLRLGYNDLTGEIPAGLGHLAALESLDLFNNDLTGPIPAELGRLAALKSLNLSHNHLTGEIAAELGSLATLEVLGLTGNELAGSIPSELGSLAALRELHLGGNHLTGEIAAELGSLATLEVLGLAGNNLTGSIPSELGSLTELKSLSLYGNALTGPIPAEIGKLSALEHLHLGNIIYSGRNGNNLTGEIPAELGNLARLESLDLSDNNLTGRIPGDLGNLTALKRLVLEHNELSGPLPTELLNLASFPEGGLFFLRGTDVCVPGTAVFWQSRVARNTARFQTSRGWCNAADQAVLASLYEAAGGSDWKRRDEWVGDAPVLSQRHGVTADSLGRVVALSLPGNNLVGRITAVPWGALAGLKALDVAGNPGLHGPFPLSLTRVSLDTLRFSGTELCSSQEAREWLVGIPVVQGTGKTCEPLSDRDILVALYHATGGPDWRRDGNWLTDSPLEEWHGVDVNELGQVTRLDLRSNNLSGPVPPELGSLSSLEDLRLSGNTLTGSIPSELGRLAALEWLILSHNHLTGSIPPELGSLTALAHLRLFFNELQGPIPAGLGDLVALESLVLHSNELTGPIPPELGNLIALRELLLGSNELTGPIPPELGNLIALRELLLGGNDLTGPIPAELGNLATLEQLDLTGNELTGPIPKELGNLSALRFLWLGGDLTGEIPRELGNLSSLRRLGLSGTDLTGPIPAELGNLAAMDLLNLSHNALTGEIPAGLGILAALRGLSLSHNDLFGPVPSEMGNLAALEWLDLRQNEGLSGALPTTMTALHELRTMQFAGTGLCGPADPAFQRWLDLVFGGRHPRARVASCSPGAAYLVQSVQSRDFPVPLVAGRDALLRVFPTAPSGTRVPVPAVRARFYTGMTEVYSVEIPGKPGPLPVDIQESDLRVSANVRIPGDVLRPGLEMVVEIDPDGMLNPSFGVSRRLPAEGRATVDVRALPTMELTRISHTGQSEA